MNRHGTTHDRRTIARRGNTIVLVVGILVLLVIIATSYVTRTHAGRVTAVSQQRASLRDDNARVIAESIADEIAGALFVRPLAVAPSGINPVASSNAPRFAPRPDLDGDGTIDYLPVRYGVDPLDVANGGDGLPDVPYNFAPYHVAPYTNWPDNPPPPAPQVWPNDLAQFDPFEGNPIGNPGFGDTRWLADTEPVRVLLPSGQTVFSHWRHMTNLSRPGNGWRICRDLSDVGNVTGVTTPPGRGGVLLDLGLPVEQFIWRPGDGHQPIAGTGLPSVNPLTPANNFEERWASWLLPFPAFGLPGYAGAYLDATWIPPNFLNLRDLNGDDIAYNAFSFGVLGNGIHDRPESEFIPGTARHTVGRFLADTDGDGFTDAFWFLAPTMTERGIRQVVAVRIVDNSAMLNANVATRFAPIDIVNQPPYRTRGTTPADLALVGGLSPTLSIIDWNVGFYDNRDHVDNTLADPLGLWTRHLRAVGLWPYTSDPALADPYTPTRFWREDYWRRQGLDPLGADPESPYTPFGIPDEIELRMFHGNNYPWIFSRLEGTTEVSANVPGALRGNLGERGSSEVLDQLDQRDFDQFGQLYNPLLADSRRKLTLYSGARNDLMPPWLWPTLLLTDRNADGVIDDLDRRQYLAEMLKYDLRQPYYTFAGAVIQDIDRDGFIEFPTGPGGLLDDPTDDDVDFDLTITEADQLARLRDYLDRALVIRAPADDPFATVRAGEPVDSYFGTMNVDMERAERAAAAMAANVNAYRDADGDPLDQAAAVSLAEAVPLRSFDRTNTPPRILTDKTTRYLGLEAQPFLVEAVIGHVHRAVSANFDHPPVQPNPQGIAVGDNVLCYDGTSSNQGSFAAVQIANPFDKPVDLNNFRISVFGQDLDLDTVAQNQLLQPDAARTYLSMDQSASIGNPISAANWKAILGLDTLGPADLIDTGVWSRDRSFYDGNTLDDSAIELWRRVDVVSDIWVLVDRIDVKPGLPDEPAPGTFGNTCTHRKFGPLVTQLDSASLDLQVQPPPCTEPGNNVPWPGVLNLGNRDRWSQWIRVSRPRDHDVDGSGTVEADERNPRFVFGRAQVDMPVGTGEGRAYTDADAPANWFGGQIAYFGSRDKQLCDGVTDTINTELDFAMQMLQKDGEFEQVGELLDVWMFGHEIETTIPGAYVRTTSTFSEWLWEEMFDTNRGYTASDERRAVNRLQPVPTLNGTRPAGAIMGAGVLTDPLDPLHAVPALPATARVLEAFVCDGQGAAPLGDVDGDGDVDYDDAQILSPRNAAAFAGRMTPGLVNVNTAAPEVMRSGPHMARIVGFDQSGTMLASPRVHVPEAVTAYRDRIVQQVLPDYRERESIAIGLRGDRGFASIGELLLLQEKPGAAPPGEPNPQLYQESFRIDFAAMDPFRRTPPASTRISTDVIDDGLPGFESPDTVAEDAEEANLLFAGVSNMITTRSDVFTVYFKVRSFTQNRVTGRWDATDPEQIVDESRYVMLVDRSEVNVPTDKPKIVYLEKLPK